MRTAVAVALAVVTGLFGLFLVFPVQDAEAAVLKWDGGGDGTSWSDPDNWSGDTLPTSTDTITIDGNSGVDSTVILDINFVLDATGTLTIDLGDALQIQSGVTLTNSGTINNSGALSNNIGGTIFNDGSITNSASINNSGTIINDSLVNNSGTIINSGTIDNSGTISNFIGAGGSISNSGTINNSGTIDNSTDAVITNSGTINNSGTITNSGSITNFSGGSINNFGTFDNDTIINNSGTVTNFDTFINDGIINNDGTINNKCGATFINNGTINGNPVNNETCAYSLNLFEGSDPSDGIVNLNQEVTARAETNDVSVDSVTFTWTNPDSTPVRTEIVLTSTGQAEDMFTPDQVGEWTVEAKFNNGVVVRHTIQVPFMVIPESPIGVAALIGSSLAALGGFMFWKSRNKPSNGITGLGL